MWPVIFWKLHGGCYMYLQSNLKNLKSIYSLDWGSREARVESGSQTTRLHSKMISRAHGIHQASSVPVSP